MSGFPYGVENLCPASSQEEDMLLTLSFFLEKMRFEAGLGAGHLEAATPDSTQQRQVSVTSDHRALHSVQFSKRVSEKPAPSDDHLHHLNHLHPDADSSGILDFLKFWTSFQKGPEMGWETNLQDFSLWVCLKIGYIPNEIAI